MRPSRATWGLRGAGSPTRGTRSDSVGPAAATTGAGAVRVTRRTAGVMSRTAVTVRTSTGRTSPGRVPGAASAGLISVGSTRSEPNEADPTSPGGLGPAGPASRDEVFTLRDQNDALYGS